MSIINLETNCTLFPLLSLLAHRLDAVTQRSRFVLNIKKSGSDNPTYKAMFVILDHKDPDKDRIVNEAPAVLRSLLFLLFSLFLDDSFDVWSGDVSQAIVPFQDYLGRDVHISLHQIRNVLET